ncbi:MAG: hypothetical protein BHW65_09220 [Verrucomicrobia bacterium CAG:312_58_20]|nr:MAG: hypothetical protein BHW65_09220 [Verrucomicrobia bacterium CAG:312_58_20]
MGGIFPQIKNGIAESQKFSDFPLSDFPRISSGPEPVRRSFARRLCRAAEVFFAAARGLSCSAAAEFECLPSPCLAQFNC